MIFRAITHLFYILLVSGLISCSKDKINKIENLNGNKIGVVGHAGAGFSSYDRPLPDNSFSSIVKAIEAYNAMGVEVDVQLSSDKVLYLYHNNKLSSATNFNGCIYNYTSQELKNCTYKNSEEKLATLNAIVDRFSERPVKPFLFLDVRTFSECLNPEDAEAYSSLLAKEIAGFIKNKGAYDWIFVEAQDSAFLKKIMIQDPSIKLIMDGGSNFPLALNFAERNSLNGLIFANRDISSAEIKIAHQKGLMVSLFDLPSRKETIEGINKSPDFIQTDNIPLLQQLLK